MRQILEVGAYDRNEKKNTFHYVDEHYLLLTTHGNQGKGDCIGRSLRGYLAYGDIKLIDGISNCWKIDNKGKWYGVRHPDMDDETGKFAEGFWKDRMSRDHFVNTLVALKLSYEDAHLFKLYHIVRSAPFRIKRMSRWTLTLILWTKSLIGNKQALWWYLFLENLIVRLIYVPMFRLGYLIAGWGGETFQSEWKPVYLQNQRKLNSMIDKLIFPSYALQYCGMQLLVTDNTFPKMKSRLKRAYGKMVGRTNWVQLMLFGKDVYPAPIQDYKPMQGGRWSGNLNPRNDRNLFTMGFLYPVNNLDVDLVRVLYNNYNEETGEISLAYLGIKD